MNLIRKDTYNNSHWLHTLILFGYDDEKKYFNVIEHDYKDDMTYKSKIISYEDIINSHEGFMENYSRYANFPTYLEIYLDSDGSHDELLQCIKIFKENILGKRKEIQDGINELEIMVDRISSIILNKSKLDDNIESLLELLNGIIKSKKVEQYNLVSLLGNEDVFVKLNKKTIDLWDFIRNMIVKYSYVSRYSKEKMLLLVDKLKEIYNLEVTNYNKLFLWCMENN